MITVKAAHERMSKENKTFVSLELIGDMELVQSQTTGRFYATARRCFINSTFTLDIAKKFVGNSLPGKIVRVQCESYDYTIPESGEIVTLGYRYEYQPDERPEYNLEPEVKRSFKLEEDETKESVLEEMNF